MKKFSATQLRVIIALNFVIIAVLAGLFFFDYGSPDVPTAAQPGDVYKRIRTADISLQPNIAWDLRLVGSKQDEAIYTYVCEQTNRIYVFGNSLSADGDFNVGVFLIILDAYGTTLENGFCYYGSPIDILRSVTPADGGFLLAVEGDLPYMLLVDMDGRILKTVSGFLTGFEYVHSVRLYTNGYLLFTQPYNSTYKIKNLRCIFFDRQLRYEGHSVTSEQYSLEPIEVVVISGRPVAFCNAQSSLETIVASVVFERGSCSTNLYYKYPGYCAGLSVNDGQIILLTAYGGSSIFTLNAQLEIVGRKQLSQLMPRLLINVDEQTHVAFLHGSTHIIGSGLQSLKVYEDIAVSDVGYIYDSAVVVGSGVLAVYTGALEVERIELGVASGLLGLGEKRTVCVWDDEGDLVVSLLR